MLITPTRRTFLSLVAAPAIVRISSLMPVKAVVDPMDMLRQQMDEVYAVTRRNMNDLLYGDVKRRAFRPRFFLDLVPWDAIADVPARKTPYEPL